MATQCQTCGALCAECIARRAAKARQRCSNNGCGKTLENMRSHARYCSELCRWQAKNKRTRARGAIAT